MDWIYVEVGEFKMPKRAENQPLAFKWNGVRIYLPRVVISSELQLKAEQRLRVSERGQSEQSLVQEPEEEWNPNWDDEEDDIFIGSKDVEDAVNSERHPPESNLKIAVLARKSPTRKSNWIRQNDSKVSNATSASKTDENAFFKRKFYSKEELLNNRKGNTTNESEGDRLPTPSSTNPHRENVSSCEKVDSNIPKIVKREMPNVLARKESQNLQCAECGRRFSKIIHYNVHMKIHARMGFSTSTLAKTFRCCLCDSRFSMKSELDNHLLTCQNSKLAEKRVSGSATGVKRSGDLDGSMNSWKSDITSVRLKIEDPLNCNDCGELFKEVEYLVDHLLSMHGKRPLICIYCGKPFTSVDTLMTHSLTHTEDALVRFGCPRCGRRFGRQNQLNFHVKFCKTTSFSPTNDSMASKLQSSSTTDNEKKVSEEEWFKCSTCGLSFAREVGLKQHILKAHSLNPANTNKKDFVCPKCGRKFKHEHYLNFHLRRHTNKTCEQCGARVADNLYAEHKRSCQPKDVQTKLSSTSAALLTTETTHSVIGNIPKNMPSKTCEICMKEFPSLSELQQHCLVHAFGYHTYIDDDEDFVEFLKKLPFYCQQSKCERRFSDQSDLMNHINHNHAKEGSHCCGICGKDFTSDSDLNSHRSSHRESKSRNLQKELGPERMELEGFTTSPTLNYYYLGTHSLPDPYVLLTENLKSAADAIVERMVKTWKALCTTSKISSPALHTVSEQQKIGRGRWRIRADIPFQTSYLCNCCNKKFQKRNLYLMHLYQQETLAKNRCHLCERKFMTVALLQTHIKRHADPNYTGQYRRGRNREDIPFQSSYTCQCCNKRFQKRNLYLMHLHQQKQLSKNQCHLCERKFMTSKLLQCHLKRHTDDPNYTGGSRRIREDIPFQSSYTCQCCSRKFQKRNLYLMHLYQQETLAKNRCHLCERKFMTEKLLKDHIQRHDDPNFRGHAHRGRREDIPFQSVYICTCCNQSFQRRNAYLMHLYQQKLKEKFKCHVCGRSVGNKFALESHLKRHEDPNYTGWEDRRGRRCNIPYQDTYTCSKCPEKSFADRKTYILHVWQHNQQNLNKCPHCLKGFITKQQLLVHMQKHSDPNYNGRCGRGGRSDIPIQDIYYCEECVDRKSFTDRTRYLVHLRYHSLEEKYVCPHCPRRFKVEAALKVHLHSHSNVKSQKCEDCLKMFKSRTSLYIHKKICKKVQCKFKCKTCNNMFHTKIMLVRHFERCHGKKSGSDIMLTSPMIEHPCPHCSQTFNTTFGLKRHISIYHPQGASGGPSTSFWAADNSMQPTLFGTEDDKTGDESEQTRWNNSDDDDHHGGDDYMDVTDMMATSFCETELEVRGPLLRNIQDPPKLPAVPKRESRSMCQCGTVKKYESQKFCHNVKCPCIQAGRRCASTCRCSSECLNRNDCQQQQQKLIFTAGKQSMVAEDSQPIVVASSSVPSTFARQDTLPFQASYNTFMSSEFISIDSQHQDESIRQLSLEGYVEGADDFDPLADPLPPDEPQPVPVVTEEVVVERPKPLAGRVPSAVFAKKSTGSGNGKAGLLFLKCQHCPNRTLKSIPTFISHIFLHGGQTNFRCPLPLCKESFHRVTEYVQHLDRHNTGISLQCTKCSSKFRSGSDMDKHLKVHHSRHLECGVCSIRFSDTRTMMSHWSQKHPTCQCGVCMLKFFSYEDLGQHMSTIHCPYECEHCNVQVESVTGLLEHYLQNHDPSKRVTSPARSVQLAKCNYCEQYFPSTEELNQHILKHLPGDGSKTVQTASLGSNFCCSQCGTSCGSIEEFNEHLNNHLQQSTFSMPQVQTNYTSNYRKSQPPMQVPQEENIEAVETLTCSVCDKNFKSRHAWVIHVRSHSLCVCSVCFSVFNTETELDYHLATSSCVVYKCDSCSKNFNAKKHLAQHIRFVHGKEKTRRQGEADPIGRGMAYQYEQESFPVVVASTSLAAQQTLVASSEFRAGSTKTTSIVEEITID